jgi:hypothetical protein
MKSDQPLLDENTPFAVTYAYFAKMKGKLVDHCGIIKL